MRITEVANESPGAKAGLIPEADYVIGSTQFVYENERSLSSYLKSIENKGKFIRTLDLIVYNKDTCRTRKVIVTPSR